MEMAGYFELGIGAVRSHRLRSMLSILGIAIGIAAGFGALAMIR